MSAKLLQFNVTHLLIDFIQPDEANALRGTEIDMKFQIEFGKHIDIDRQFRVGLKARFTERTPGIGDLGFRVEVDLAGVVLVEDEIPEDQVAFNAQANGISLLYGTMRGIILSATGMFPTGPMLLPSVSSLAIMGVDKPRKDAKHSRTGLHTRGKTELKSAKG